ncbi:MAG: hypothetical protein ABL958_00805 [Bdellovibrionia bacterium]
MFRNTLLVAILAAPQARAQASFGEVQREGRSPRVSESYADTLTDRRFLSFGTPTTIAQVPDGGLLAVRGPHALSNERIQRDYFGFKYSLKVNGAIRNFLVSESGLLLDLDAFPVNGARTTNDSRRVYTAVRYTSMNQIAARIEREGSGLYGAGNPRDFQPGQVRASILPIPESNLHVILKVETFGPIPGPVFVDARYIVRAGVVYFPAYAVTVPLEKITGIYDYFSDVE